jgi:hypothetical protein
MVNQTNSEAPFLNVAPAITGNEQIEILNPRLVKKNEDGKDVFNNLVVTIRNIADAHIGKAEFETVFYDDKGAVVDTVRQSTMDFEKNSSRILSITPDKAEANRIISYDINIVNVIMSPVSTVTGNDSIRIMNHIFLEGNNPFGSPIKGAGVEIGIRNISGKTIATAVFEAVFYDLEFNILDKVKHTESEIKANSSRAITIVSDKCMGLPARRYEVQIVKTVTSEIEKVKVLRDWKRTTGRKEEISGIVKNISEVRTDAALIVTFIDDTQEKIGISVLNVKDIEPHSTKSFKFYFMLPVEGVHSNYTIDVGEVIENYS